VDTHSFAFWVYVDATPVANQAVFTECTANGAGTGRLFVYVVAPTTAGFQVRVLAKWTTDGRWDSSDISLNEWHHIAITYDRGATTNDPVMYVDGTSVTVTEELTPTTTVQSGQDTVKLGENPGGGEDANCAVAYVVDEAGVLWTLGDQVNRHRNWGRAGGGAQVCLPLVTDKLGNDGTVATTLTATGTTVISIPKVQRPGGMSMMGCGI
jgi:hypothetical protein